MASVTITIPAARFISSTTAVAWSYSGQTTSPSLGTSLSVGGTTELFFGALALRRQTDTSNSFSLQLSSTSGGSPQTPGPDFSNQMETSGTTTIVASDNETLVITGFSDATEPYEFDPSNESDLINFADHVAGLTDKSVSVTFNDNAATAPVFTDATGDAQAWETGTAITAVQVPAAAGSPTPTYSVVGELPAGISFDPATRQITGTPTTLGSGTITIRATNANGSADWTVGYTITRGGFVTFTLLGSNFTDNGFVTFWQPATNSRPGIPGSLMADGDPAFLARFFTAYNNGRVHIAIENSQTSAIANDSENFTETMRTNGVITAVDSAGNSLVVNGISDTSEIYTWTPSNSADVIAWTNGVRGLTDRDITVTFNDGRTPPVTPTFDVGATTFDVDVGWSISNVEVEEYTIGQTTYDIDVGWNVANVQVQALAPVPIPAQTYGVDVGWGVANTTVIEYNIGATTFNVDLGWTASNFEVDIPASNVGALSYGVDVDWSAAVSSFDLTTLLAANADTTLRDVEAAALIRRQDARDGTLYADSTRGGTDTPQQGELGLSASETVISRILRVNATTFRLNDNNVPSDLSFTTYFGPNGEGRNLRATVITPDASASLELDSVISSDNNFINFTSTPAFDTVLQSINVGDLFIVAFTRPYEVAPITYDIDVGWNIASVAVSNLAPVPVGVITYDVDVGWSLAGIEVTEYSVGATTFDVDVGWSIANVTVSDVVDRNAIVSFRAGNPTVNVSAATSSLVTRDAQVAYRAGNPTVSVRANAQSFTNRNVSVSYRAGNPTVNVSADAGIPILPDPVEGLELTEVGKTFALVSWDIPYIGDAPIIRYEYSIDGGAWATTGSTDTSYRFGGLVAGRRYNVRVRAVNAFGAGTASQLITIRTETLLPIIVAYPNDRLDTIAQRAYPDISPSEGVRMLIWANLSGSLGNRLMPDGTRVFGLPLAFDGGEELFVPTYDPGEFGSTFAGFEPYPNTMPLEDVEYLDGDTGGIAPSERNGLPYIASTGITRRLNTDYGRQFMEPTYGLQASTLLDDPVSGIVSASIEGTIRESLEGLEGATVEAFEVTIGASGELGIRMILDAETEE